MSEEEAGQVVASERESALDRDVETFPADRTEDEFVQFLSMQGSKKLRSTCTRLQLNPQARQTQNCKDGYIELLTQYRRARLRGEVFTGYTRVREKRQLAVVEGENRTKHCGFRLANVLFSASFYGKMGLSGALPATGLTVASVDGRSTYWRQVAAVFASDNAQFDGLVGPPGRYDGIDPRMAPPHTSAKLCTIWKDMTMRYEVLLTRWRQLGTDKADFSHFCGDFLEVRYLHEWLQIRPIVVGQEQARPLKRARMRVDDVVSIDRSEEGERQSILRLSEVY